MSDTIAVYNMRLHSTLTVDNGRVNVLCVPGGWIYTTYTSVYANGEESYIPSSCFVPREKR